VTDSAPNTAEELAALGVPEPVTAAGARTTGGLRDYVAWHDAYDDPGSSLSKRLRRVRAEIARFLDDTAPRPVRVVSLCAGDGRDLLGVLADREDRHRVTGALVEILPELVQRARDVIDHLAMTGELEVRQADAGLSDSYARAVPADLVVVSGVMGNISADDVRRLIHATRELTAPEATVLWTRGRMEPDLGPEIRSWFDEAGFASVALFDDIEGSPMRLGVERLVAAPRALRPGRRLFTFLR
jgi:hypothetical protein